MLVRLAMLVRSPHRPAPSLAAKAAAVACFSSAAFAGDGEGESAGRSGGVDESAVESAPLLKRETLLGDWGGLRRTLGERGIGWDLSYTTVYAGVFRGDVRDKDFDWGHRFDAFFRADTEQMGLWPGGRLHTHLEYRFGEAGERPFPRTGGLWPPNSMATFPLSSPEELVATSLFYTQDIGDRGSLMLGKINALDLLAGDPFFGGWGRDRFSNLAFTAPPSGVVPPVIVGVIYNYRLDPLTLTLMVFDPDDHTNDYWASDLFEDGVNLSAGVLWSGKIADRSSTLGLTATYSTREGVDLRDLALPPGLVAGTKEGSYNVAVSASHLFWESAIHPGKGLGVYGRAAIADGNPNPIDSSLAGGFAGYGLIPDRPDDVFGLGFYRYNFSDDLRLGIAPIIQFDNETGAEIFYNVAITPWMRVTADLQWVRPVRSEFRDTVAGGIRVSIDF